MPRIKSLCHRSREPTVQSRGTEKIQGIHATACYLKGEMRDVAGGRHVVASPITALELRVTNGIVDILDWHTGRTESARWMSQTPGRFTMTERIRLYVG
jgi:hypothetical protein